jgi:outer membrane protein assembly factor BamB
MRRYFFLVPALFLLSSCSGRVRFEKAGSLDLPGWGSFRGNPQNTGYVSSEIQTPDKLLWKFNAKKPLKSTPIFTGKIAVVGSLDKRVHFLDALSGKDLGRYKFSSSVSVSACAEGERVYFGPDRGEETLFALNIRTGQVLWKRSLGDLSSSPVVCDDKIFAGSTDGTLRALDKITGEDIWQFKTGSSKVSAPACQDAASLSANEGTLYLGSGDGHLYSLSMGTGELIWKFKADGGIHSSPAVKNGMVFFGSVDGNLYALNADDGSLVWKFRAGADIYSSPAVAGSLVYIGSNDYFVYAVSQKTGELAWKFETEGLVRSSPVAAGDKLFFGSYDGNFYVLDRFSGKLLWKYQTKRMISASPAYHDGKVKQTSSSDWLSRQPVGPPYSRDREGKAGFSRNQSDGSDALLSWLQFKRPSGGLLFLSPGSSIDLRRSRVNGVMGVSEDQSADRQSQGAI